MKKLLLLIAIITIGCGSRKSTVSKVEEKKSETTEIKTTDNSTTKTETITDTKTDEVTEIETIEPIDNTKPFIVDGKTYTNTKVVKAKTKRLKTDKVNTNTIANNNVKKSETKQTESKINNKNAVRERTFNLWQLCWLLLLIPIFLGCRYLYLHNKKKIDLIV